ncbi:MAG: hypothetical protein KBS59_03785 [Clostridiales bacterium]|nr:hypothetical protein [Clostridiales bacterium]
MKVVINRCFGGYGLSREAYEFLGMKWDGYGYAWNIERNDPKLVACVEALGEKANGRGASLRVVEVPDDVEWNIEEYDGMETIEEVHRTWY